LEFDEETFVSMAIQHKVAHSALAGLSMQGITLSEVGQSALKMSAHTSALRGALTALEAVKITETLARHGIASAVIKGPAAAIQLYGNLNTREFYDLDIVANIKEASEAISLMHELGYEPDVRAANKITQTYKPKKPNPIAQRSHHIAFYHPARPFRVELHDRAGWEAEPYGHDDFDAVFSRIVMIEATVGDKKLRFPSLSPVDHAVLLAAHGAHHAWCLLHWVLDAARVITMGKTVYYKELADRVTVLDMGRQLKVACAIVQSLYSVEIPEPLARIMEGEKKNLDGAIRYAKSRLEKGGRDLETFRHALALPLFYLVPQLKGTHQKWKVLFAPFKIPVDDLEALPLPGVLAFFHILLRPLFVIGRRVARKKQARIQP
jgi:hypothetical protein